MANSEDDAGSSSLGDKDGLGLLQDVLMKIINCAENFEKKLGALMNLQRNDEQKEKAIARSMDEYKEDLILQISQLTTWIANREAEEKTEEDRIDMRSALLMLKPEIKNTIETAMESIQRKVKRYKEEAKAQKERRKNEKKWLDSSLGVMVSHLSKAANQVNEMDDESE